MAAASAAASGNSSVCVCVAVHVKQLPISDKCKCPYKYIKSHNALRNISTHLPRHMQMAHEPVDIYVKDF